MLGRGLEHNVVPYFFSDLADWVVHGVRGAGLRRHGDPRARSRTASSRPSTSTTGQVKAALSVGCSDDLDAARRFISEKPTVDEAALAGSRHRPVVPVSRLGAAGSSELPPRRDGRS
jgi:hypothetical protein